MKNIKLYYSIVMFTLTSLMLLFIPMCYDVAQYSFIGFMLIVGYIASYTAFTSWKDDYFTNSYDKGYSDGWKDYEKMREIKHNTNKHIKTFKNLEGYSYDGE